MVALSNGHIDDHIEVIGAKDDSRLYIKCPGIECHSTATGKRDTMLHTDGAPTIVCMHQSCAQAVESKNLELRRAFPSTVTRIAPHTDFRRQREIEAAKRAIAKVQAERAQERIIQGFPWPRCDIWEDSPVRLTGSADIAETRSFLSLAFSKGDLLWIGQPEHSNEAGAIRRLEDWLTDESLLSRPSICPNALATIQGGRKNTNISEPRYVVLEADSLSPDHEENQDLSGALIRWLRESAGLNLFAVISSGRKSLHAWFAVDDRLKEFIESPSAGNLLASLGFDSAGVRPAQAFRFPGHVRHETGQIQTIYYLDPAAGFNRNGVSTKQQPLCERSSTDEK
jgi:hypothetical protein